MVKKFAGLQSIYGDQKTLDLYFKQMYSDGSLARKSGTLRVFLGSV